MWTGGWRWYMISLLLRVYLCKLHTATSLEVCSGQNFTASCSSGTVVMIVSAVYGRMQLGVCRTSNVHIGCSADVSSYVERRCAGRRRCKVAVTDQLRRLASDNDGCPIDQLGYLRVVYHCLHGKQN